MFFSGSSDIRIRNKQTTSPRLGGSWLSWFLGFGRPRVLSLILTSLPLGSIEWPKATGLRGSLSSFTVMPIPFMRVGCPLLKNAGSPWEMQRCSHQEKTGDSTPPFRTLLTVSLSPQHFDDTTPPPPSITADERSAVNLLDSWWDSAFPLFILKWFSSSPLLFWTYDACDVTKYGFMSAYSAQDSGTSSWRFVCLQGCAKQVRVAQLSKWQI